MDTPSLSFLLSEYPESFPFKGPIRNGGIKKSPRTEISISGRIETKNKNLLRNRIKINRCYFK